MNELGPICSQIRDNFVYPILFQAPQLSVIREDSDFLALNIRHPAIYPIYLQLWDLLVEGFLPVLPYALLAGALIGMLLREHEDVARRLGLR